MPDEINVKFTARPYRPKYNRLYTVKFLSSFTLLAYAFLILIFYYFQPMVTSYNQSVSFCSASVARITREKLTNDSAKTGCSKELPTNLLLVFLNTDSRNAFLNYQVIMTANYRVIQANSDLENTEVNRTRELEQQINREMQKFYKLGIVETSVVDLSVLGKDIPIGQRYDIYNQYWQASKQDLDNRADQKIGLDLQEFYNVIITSGKTDELGEYLDFYDEFSKYSKTNRIANYDKLAARKLELKAILR